MRLEDFEFTKNTKQINLKVLKFTYKQVVHEYARCAAAVPDIDVEPDSLNIPGFFKGRLLDVFQENHHFWLVFVAETPQKSNELFLNNENKFIIVDNESHEMKFFDYTTTKEHSIESVISFSQIYNKKNPQFLIFENKYKHSHSIDIKKNIILRIIHNNKPEEIDSILRFKKRIQTPNQEIISYDLKEKFCNIILGINQNLIHYYQKTIVNNNIQGSFGAETYAMNCSPDQILEKIKFNNHNLVGKFVTKLNLNLKLGEKVKYKNQLYQIIKMEHRVDYQEQISMFTAIKCKLKTPRLINKQIKNKSHIKGMTLNNEEVVLQAEKLSSIEFKNFIISIEENVSYDVEYS